MLWCPQDPNRAPWLRATDNFIKALQLAGDGPALHMEDDIIFCPNFREKMAAEINARPDMIVQTFTRRKHDIKWGSRLDAFFIGGLCFYMPPGYAKQIIDYLPTYIEEKGQEKDGMPELDNLVCYWLKSRKEKHWVVVPSLVDHFVGPSSVQKIRNHHRGSTSFHLHFEDH